MPKTGEIEKKVFTFTECKMTEGSGNGGFEGYASVKGNVDSYGDEIADGAYKNLQEVLVKKGWSGFNHSSKPVGMVMGANEDSHGLKITVEFHSTAEAQEVRTIMKERLAAGKDVGMSIMFRTLEAAYETRDDKEIRILKGIETIEAGFVMLPANDAAAVTNVKSATGGSLGEDFEAARELVEKAIGRVMDLKESASGDLTPGRIALVDELYQKVGEWREAVQRKAGDDQPEMANPEEVAAQIAALGLN
jgi:HK97 family phage prohead protease